MLYKVYKELNEIPYIEQNVVHLFHLFRMYSLVVDKYIIHLFIFTYEKDTKQVDALITLERDKPIPYYLHFPQSQPQPLLPLPP